MVQLEFLISFHNQETVNAYKYELASQLVFLSSFGNCSSVQENFGFMLETPSLEWILCGHLLFLSLFLFFTKSMFTVQLENEGGSTQWGQGGSLSFCLFIYLLIYLFSFFQNDHPKFQTLAAEGTLAVVLCYTDCAWSLAFLILPEVNIYWNNFVSGIWWEQVNNYLLLTLL